MEDVIQTEGNKIVKSQQPRFALLKGTCTLSFESYSWIKFLQTFDLQFEESSFNINFSI